MLAATMLFCSGFDSCSFPPFVLNGEVNVWRFNLRAGDYVLTSCKPFFVTFSLALSYWEVIIQKGWPWISRRRLSAYLPNVVSPFVKSVRVRIFGPCPRVGITCHRHLSGSLKCGLSFNKLSLLLWFQVIVNTLVAQINCCYSVRNA